MSWYTSNRSSLGHLPDYIPEYKEAEPLSPFSAKLLTFGVQLAVAGLAAIIFSFPPGAVTADDVVITGSLVFLFGMLLGMATSWRYATLSAVRIQTLTGAILLGLSWLLSHVPASLAATAFSIIRIGG